ncbi:hypothetical protein Efla_007229 [Eimeria flavescens]
MFPAVDRLRNTIVATLKSVGGAAGVDIFASLGVVPLVTSLESARKPLLVLAGILSHSPNEIENVYPKPPVRDYSSCTALLAHKACAELERWAEVLCITANGLFLPQNVCLYIRPYGSARTGGLADCSRCVTDEAIQHHQSCG